MTIEPSYTENELRRAGAVIHLSGYLARVMRHSKPDTRLQDIANAPKCKHGRIDIHFAQHQMHDSFGNKIRPQEYTCKGAPELRSLLEDLNKEKDPPGPPSKPGGMTSEEAHQAWREQLGLDALTKGVHDHPDHDSSGEGPSCCNEWN